MKKSKIYLRILAFTLSALLLSSCSNNTENPNADTSDPASSQTDIGGDSASESVSETETETTAYISDDLPDEDFGGYAFRILSCYFHDQELATFITYDELTGVPVNDELFYSKTKNEERFNVNISWIETGNEDAGKTTAMSAVNAGDDLFDMLIGKDKNTVALGKAGVLLNLHDVEEFNFDKPWWPSHAVEAWTVANKLFAASNYMSYCGIHWTRIITFNKDWAEQLQLEMPYNAVREGKWTLDMLNQLTENVTNDVDGNGVIDSSDNIAFVSNGTWYCLQEAVGIPIYRRDENGNLYADMDVERADGYLEKMRALTTGDKYSSNVDCETMFASGKALFAYTEVADAYEQYRESDVRYGILPTPKYDETQESYVSSCTDVPWGIPKTVKGEQQHIVGTICEALSCYNYNNMLPVYLESALKSRAADSADDSEMLQLIADSRTIAFAHCFEMMMSNIFGDIGTSGQGSSSYFASREKPVSKLINNLVNSYNSID